MYCIEMHVFTYNALGFDDIESRAVSMMIHVLLVDRLNQNVNKTNIASSTVC